MTAILVLHACDLLTRKAPAARFVIAAVLVALGAAIVQRAGFDLHRHFNHNDLFHVVQIGANYLFYHGAILLRDRD